MTLSSDPHTLVFILKEQYFLLLKIHWFYDQSVENFKISRPWSVRVTQAWEAGKYDQDMTFPFWGGRAWATTPLVFSLINDLGLMLTSKKIIMSGQQAPKQPQQQPKTARKNKILTTSSDTN